MRRQINFLLAILFIILVVTANSCSETGPANVEATLEDHVQSTLTAISAVDATVEARVQATMDTLMLPSPEPTATPIPTTPSLENRSLSFAGYNWTVKSSEGRVGPGPNFFSDRKEDVFVDEEGRLHLRIMNRDGQWYVTEVVNTENLGYGLYTFRLVTPVDQLDPNIVLGLFTWDDNAPEENYREIDIEFSRWGQPENDNGQYVVQPYYKTANIHRFNVVLGNQTSTHSFLWQPDGIFFQSSYGYQTATPFPADIQSWSYEGSDNPSPGGENIRFNFWLRNGEAPLDGQDSEVIISSFSFTPWSNLPASSTP
jgi:hypothetical protein